LTLTLEIPGEVIWSTNQTVSSITVLSAGVYTAQIVTECNMLAYVYTVAEIDCNEVIYAATIFSPNGDGVNDRIKFHLNPMLTIGGTIRIFDRWGALVFQSSSIEELEWEGKSITGTSLGLGVYLWTFVSQDQSIPQAGDITLIR
jgi:gliding motility-associated-like protein